MTGKQLNFLHYTADLMEIVLLISLRPRPKPLGIYEHKNCVCVICIMNLIETFIVYYTICQLLFILACIIPFHVKSMGNFYF